MKISEELEIKDISANIYNDWAFIMLKNCDSLY